MQGKKNTRVCLDKKNLEVLLEEENKKKKK